MHPEIIVSASVHSLPESVAAALVSKADYDALAARLAAAEAELKLARKVVRVTRSFPNNLMMDALDEYDAFMKGKSK